MEVDVGIHAGVAFYGKQVNLLSELHLLEIPKDQWPSHPNRLSALDLEIHNRFAFGVHGGARKELGSGKIFAELLFSATHAPFVAEILNDPEDDGNEDVNLDTNPIDIGFQFGYRF